MGGANHRFPSTRHSLVAQAAEEPAGAPAREAIVSTYWKPVYKYIRIRWRQSNDAAKDLTQGFFTELFERSLLARFDPAKASFRTYLRLCVDGFAAHTWQAENRLKRGGGATVIPLEEESVQEPVSEAPGDSPEEIFLREWQRQVFSLAIEDLSEKAQASGKSTAFHIFADYDLAEDEQPSYRQLADRYGVAVTTVTNHLAWARRELKHAVLERIQSVTSSRRELHAEAKAVLGGPRG